VEVYQDHAQHVPKLVELELVELDLAHKHTNYVLLRKTKAVLLLRLQTKLIKVAIISKESKVNVELL